MLTGPYGYRQPPEFSLRTKKHVMTKELEEITRNVKSLELALNNLQGLWGKKISQIKTYSCFQVLTIILALRCQV